MALSWTATSGAFVRRVCADGADAAGAAPRGGPRSGRILASHRRENWDHRSENQMVAVAHRAVRPRTPAKLNSSGAADDEFALITSFHCIKDPVMFATLSIYGRLLDYKDFAGVVCC
ncbi:hypothetical protein EVAR_47474_1 [Eumeta japonica]|uniref:Uncharacterized protein n=1 Tax=Eumeta variegata TaxID=151549 RepID=A0A4C1XAD9_EUMVA|nr:hypothetical protein EVAR_47474_1 [Eumeta japonica]